MTLIIFLKSLKLLITTPHARIIASLLFNFRHLPFEQAILLPVFIYGNAEINIGNNGRIILRPTYVTAGMIKIGILLCDIFGHKPWMSTRLNIEGVWEINGVAEIENGSIVYVGKKARLSVGHAFFLHARSKIVCYESITIGRRVRTSWEVQIFDTNFHYLLNTDRNEIGYNNKPIKIGNYCWIGNRVSIMKGTVLPDGSTVAANSVANKDFTQYGENCVFAGQPAIHKKSSVRRLWVPPYFDLTIDEYFKNTNKRSLSLDSEECSFIRERMLT